MVVLIFWWMLLVWLLAIIGYWVLHRWQHKRKRGQLIQAIAVAHTSRMTDLPVYRNVLRRYRLMMRLVFALLSLNFIVAVVMTARPAAVSIITPTQQNRDIMLCLDTSGSVLAEDTKLLNRFSSLVKSFKGQRFGLTLFNASAVTIIPLNDNYELISQRLASASQAFKEQKGPAFTALTNGTLAGYKNGTSLVGDGLTTCIQRMGANAQRRSQSVILATDNEANGKPIVGMAQAIGLAKQRNIHIYAVDPGVHDGNLATSHSQLEVVASQTDGGYYQLGDQNVVSSIIDSIAKQVPEEFIGLAQQAINDNPEPFIYAAVLMGIASVILLWRLEQ